MFSTQPKLKFHPLTGERLAPLGIVGGKTVWPIMGGDDTVPPAGGDGGGDGGKSGGDGGDGEKKLTQSEVNAIAAREKAQGKDAAKRELAEQWGVSIEEAGELIKQAKETADAKKSDADKDREKAATEKAEAEKERQAAKQEVHQARLERAFAKTGLDLEDGDEKSKRLLKLVTVEPGASYEDVLKDVQQLKTDFPALFGADDGTDDSKKRRTPGGDPKGTPPPPRKGEDKYAAGAERAKARYAGITQ